MTSIPTEVRPAQRSRFSRYRHSLWLLTKRDLRVRYTLQGTVQRDEHHWRVSIQLFDAVMQRTTASETHDFKLDNVFDVQDGVGRHVVDLLHRRFPHAALSRDRYSSDPEAYNAFNNVDFPALV